jgi:hypothetical protein
MAHLFEIIFFTPLYGHFQLTILGIRWIIGQVMNKLLDGIACYKILKDKRLSNGFY